jgi:LacI family repressor for deo operon, udp, cdd, tsx, nupC, and nupG
MQKGFPMNHSSVPYAKISELTGVSLPTISRALRQPHLVKPDTCRKIYQAIKDLGGTLPESIILHTRELRILAIVPVLNNPFYIDIVQGIQEAATKYGCQLLIIHESLNEFNIPRVTKFIQECEISGVVIMQRLDPPILEQLKQYSKVIQCSEFNETNEISCITIDNLQATKKLLHYILSTGRKKIALVNQDTSTYTYARLRQQAYFEVLQQVGIITVSDGKFNSTVSAVTTMLKTCSIPDAIFCVSDIMAAAALRACTLEGYRIPEDIIVTGFDNIDISIMTTPNITTVHQPRGDIGFMACTQLLSEIENPDKPPQRFVLDTELIIRESTSFTP